MITLQGVLGELDDMKTDLYVLVDKGQLDDNINAQVQELLREAYYLLDEELDNAS